MINDILKNACMLLPLKQFQTRNNKVLMTTYCRVTKQAAVPSFPGGGDQEINLNYLVKD